MDCARGKVWEDEESGSGDTEVFVGSDYMLNLSEEITMR